MTDRRRRQKGFSLIELLVSVGILLFMMAVVFREVSKLQDMSRTEDMKRDVVQNAREGLDQLSRDVHTAGFPSKRMFHNSSSYTACNISPCVNVNATPENDPAVATAGFVVIANNEFVVEGDVDGDGAVDSVGYRVIPNAAANPTCPCLQRSQVNKVTGDPRPTGWGGSQNTTANYSTILENVVDPGNQTYFTYYSSTGSAISPGAAGTTFPNVSNLIRTVQVTLTVQTRG